MPEALIFSFLFGDGWVEGLGDTTPERLVQKSRAAMRILKEQRAKVPHARVDDTATFELFDANANPWPRAGLNKVLISSKNIFEIDDDGVLDKVLRALMSAEGGRGHSLPLDALAHIVLRIPLHEPVVPDPPRKTAWQHLMDDE